MVRLQPYICSQCMVNTFTKIISLAKRMDLLLYTPSYPYERFGSAHREPQCSPEALRTGHVLGEGFLAVLQGPHLTTALPCSSGLLGSCEESSSVRTTHPD